MQQKGIPTQKKWPASMGYRHCTGKLLWLVMTALVWSVMAEAQTKDTLFFNNGSRLIGEIINIRLGVLTFDTDDANEVTVKLKNLRAISATSKIYRIETIQNKVYFGQLKPHNLKSFAQIIFSGDTAVVHLEEISVLYAYKSKFQQRFSGTVGLGASYTRSSDFGRFNFDGKLAYQAKKEELTLSASGIYSLTDSNFSRDREDVTLKNNYYFSTTWFLTALLVYQRNLELGLERRFQEGLGPGNKFLTSKHVYAWARGGIVLNQERSTEGVSSSTLVELFAQLEFNFFRFTAPEISLNFLQSFYYGLTEAGRIRNDGSFSLSWKIVGDLKLNIGLYHSYDSRPPVEGGKNIDYGFNMSVSYEF